MQMSSVKRFISKFFHRGYRFEPKDNELIVYYLKKKISNEPIPYCMNIHEVNVYQYNPEQLAIRFLLQSFDLTFSGEKEWYFFTPRDRKYRNGTRPNRAADNGFWKATGADKPILHNGEVVGKKKTLVFYNGKPPNGKKTNWIMHEFKVDDPIPNLERRSTPDMRLDDWVLCRIHKNTNKSNGQETYDGHQEPNLMDANSNFINSGFLKETSSDCEDIWQRLVFDDDDVNKYHQDFFFTDNHQNPTNSTHLTEDASH
ncbi:hypothetical protein ACJIZ3_016393 [Penstemon smallii]|uniref:NAC domain-containing protein n=1 Tax=Penstemon smallii TaxID=265156 RepID=A0ABD3RQA8_9LAMI